MKSNELYRALLSQEYEDTAPERQGRVPA